MSARKSAGPGSLFLAEGTPKSVAVDHTTSKRYTPERKAEFLLSNAVDEADYRKARKEVRRIGIDPDSIPHRRPD
jgi:hypothetical protein